MLIYPDNAKVKLSSDPDVDFAIHTMNACNLRDQMRRSPNDFALQSRARHELETADATIERCSKRRDFDAKRAASLVQEARAKYRYATAYNARKVHVESEPVTSHLPGKVRTKRNMAPVYIPVWPTMRTRGLPGGMIG